MTEKDEPTDKPSESIVFCGGYWGRRATSNQDSTGSTEEAVVAAVNAVTCATAPDTGNEVARSQSGDGDDKLEPSDAPPQQGDRRKGGRRQQQQQKTENSSSSSGGKIVESQTVTMLPIGDLRISDLSKKNKNSNNGRQNQERPQSSAQSGLDRPPKPKNKQQQQQQQQRAPGQLITRLGFIVEVDDDFLLVHGSSNDLVVVRRLFWEQNQIYTVDDEVEVDFLASGKSKNGVIDAAAVRYRRTPERRRFVVRIVSKQGGTALGEVESAADEGEKLKVYIPADTYEKRNRYQIQPDAICFVIAILPDPANSIEGPPGHWIARSCIPAILDELLEDVSLDYVFPNLRGPMGGIKDRLLGQKRSKKRPPPRVRSKLEAGDEVRTSREIHQDEDEHAGGRRPNKGGKAARNQWTKETRGRNADGASGSHERVGNQDTGNNKKKKKNNDNDDEWGQQGGSKKASPPEEAKDQGPSAASSSGTNGKQPEAVEKDAATPPKPPNEAASYTTPSGEVVIPWD